jgi:hypothetical protein
MALGDREEFIATAGKSPLIVIGCLCLVKDTRQQEQVLAVLGCGQDAHGFGAAAALRDRIEQ